MRRWRSLIVRGGVHDGGKSGYERVITMAISLDEKWISELADEARHGVPEDVKFRHLDKPGRAAELAAMHDMLGFWSGSGCPAVGLEDGGLAMESAALDRLMAGRVNFELVSMLAPGLGDKLRALEEFIPRARQQGRNAEAGTAEIILMDAWQDLMTPFNGDAMGRSLPWDAPDMEHFDHGRFISGSWCHPARCCSPPLPRNLYHVHTIVIGMVICGEDHEGMASGNKRRRAGWRG
jgi:hypothetical protein